METTYASMNRPQGYRPRHFEPSRTADQRHRANGLHMQSRIHGRDLTRNEHDLERDGHHEWGQLRKSNKPIKAELARMRRVLDRGDTLSPSELDGIEDLPEARDIVKIQRERTEPKGFTLSPMKLLLRSL